MTCTCYRCTGHPIDDAIIDRREIAFHEYWLILDELPFGDLQLLLTQEVTRRYDAAERLRVERGHPN